MMFLDLAAEFVGMRLFNPRTQKHVLQIARTFTERSAVSNTEDINRLALMRYKSESLRCNRPATYNSNIKYLRMIARYGVEVGYLEHNPFNELKRVPVGEIPHKTLDLTDIATLDSLLSRQDDPQETGWFWTAVIRTFYYTGMRRRQLVNLTLADLDFENRIIRLSYQGSKTKREWFIPMHPALQDTLLDLVKRTETARGSRLKPQDYVFRPFELFPRYKADKQGRMKPETITGYFKRLSQKTEIVVGAHRFRHTFATELCNPADDSPPDIFAVQQLLGHADLKTTRIYARTKLSRLNRVVMGIKTLERRQH